MIATRAPRFSPLPCSHAASACGKRVDLAEGQRLVHADIGLGVAILGEAFLEQRHDAGIDRRIDVRRHARRIILEPEPVHAPSRGTPFLVSIVMSDFERFHVITGGPGSGKSTLVEALGRRGHAHTIEAGRAIIQDQTAIDEPRCQAATRWPSTMPSWELHSHRTRAPAAAPALLSRRARHGGLVPSPRTSPCRSMSPRRPSASGYNRRVFLAPPWPGLLARTPNASRRQRKPNGLLRRWSRPIRAAAMSSSRCRSYRSRLGVCFVLANTGA